MRKTKLTAVGANIFAGGFTLGVSKHFDVLAHLEHDDYGVAVARANFPNLKIFTSLDAWPETANKQIDFLYANPPCAIWSMAGNRQDRPDWEKDPRLQRVRDIFALVERYRPAVWAWESVCQAFERGRSLVEALADRAAELGYSASYVLVDAQYLGAPQVRKRFFLVLHRVVIDWERFKPDYARPPMTAGEALKGVKPNPHLLMKVQEKGLCGDVTRKLLKILKPGERFTKGWERIEKNPKRNAKGKILGKPSFLAFRLDPSKPTGVVFSDRTYHHTEPRHLSLNEVGALHGFPQTWDWVSLNHALTIQRGVLPPVAAWLAGAVADAVRRGKKIVKPGRTLVDLRKPPGHVQEVLALPTGVDLDWRPKKAFKETKAERTARHEETHAAIARQAKQAGRRGQPLDAAAHDQTTPAIKKRVAKESAVDYDRLPVPKPLLQLTPGAATSGELIRAAIQLGKFTDEEIAACVRRRFEGRTTSVSDVNWNRNRLKQQGEAPPDRIRR